MGLSFLFNGVPELPGNISENGLTSSHETRGPAPQKVRFLIIKPIEGLPHSAIEEMGQYSLGLLNLPAQTYVFFSFFVHIFISSLNILHSTIFSQPKYSYVRHE